MGWGLYYDSTYILVLIGMALSFGASIYLQATYRKYGQIANSRGITGAQFAQLMMHNKKINDVKIVAVSGQLSDNYLHLNKTLSLSQTTYAESTIGAIGVAGHEVGHAIQHHVNYFPFNARRWLVPVANIGATISWPLIIIGMLLGYNSFLLNAGIILFSFTFIFQVVTLPVEFNASRRALQAIEEMNILNPQEFNGTKKVLRAAALTYVAAAASVLLQLLRLILLFGGRNKD